MKTCRTVRHQQRPKSIYWKIEKKPATLPLSSLPIAALPLGPAPRLLFSTKGHCMMMRRTRRWDGDSDIGLCAQWLGQHHRRALGQHHRRAHSGWGDARRRQTKTVNLGENISLIWHVGQGQKCWQSNKETTNGIRKSEIHKRKGKSGVK